MIFCVTLLCVSIKQGIAVHENTDVKQILNVAVIGAGHAGLCSAKHALDYGYNVTVYEQTEQIGGIWYYTDQVGKDKYGVDIHSPMYQELRVNTPYQTMEFPGFHYPNNTISYPSHSAVFNYLISYADHFNLRKHIKFNHLIIRVQPIENNKWEIIVKNLAEHKFETRIFDAVFISNGHDFKTFTPKIPGVNEFNGKILHSHDFRTAKEFHNNTVLVIGGGNSGRDIVEHLAETAKRVVFSQHKRASESDEQYDHRMSWYSKIATIKDNVKSFSKNGATFIDGTYHTFDAVIFATGYNYSFAFLSTDCGIHVDRKSIQPLYRQILNIKYPTMAFIGIPESAIITTFDVQARFALKFISGEKKMPSKPELLKDIQLQLEPSVLYDTKLNSTMEYSKMLAQEAGIEGTPDVVLAIIVDSIRTHEREPFEFRNYTYTVIDGETFKKEKN